MENNIKNQDILRKGGQWLRVSILTLTTLGPVVGALLGRVRQSSDKGNQQVAQVKGKVQAAQQSTLQRLEELTATSRQQAAEQVQQLSTQAQQLQRQAEHLHKALRKEAKQRAKLAKQMRKANLKWSRNTLKRGSNLAEDLVEQGATLSQELMERGEHITGGIRERAGTLTQELSKRTGQAAQNLSERGGQVTKKLSKRTSQVAQNLSGRGGRSQKRGRLLSIIGFSAGCAAAAVATYIIVRRLVQQNSEQDQQIELPADNAVNGTEPQGQTATTEEEMGQTEGEIVILNADGTIVTIIQPENEGE